VELQFVHALQIEHEPAFAAVNFERIPVLPPGRKPVASNDPTRRWQTRPS
jgi:hypothetical protein